MAVKANPEAAARTTTVVPLEEVGVADVGFVGGKNASLGEMICGLKKSGVPVPPGFAITTAAYHAFLAANGLEERVQAALGDMKRARVPVAETGLSIRRAIEAGKWPDDIAAAVKEAYAALKAKAGGRADVAVRSSATAEDLPDASFAGQQDSFLNVSGDEELLDAARKCLASLFTDRAISYRDAKGFDHSKVALSVGVQLMVRAANGGSGVMFSVDTETGFDRAVLINAVWGLGENVVRGLVDPDEYVVYKPLLDEDQLVPIIEKRLGAKALKMIYARAAEEQRTKNVLTSKVEQTSFVLSDAEILRLARWAKAIETHYGRAMDMEWARDGETKELWVVQARPETVQSQRRRGLLKTYKLHDKGRKLLTGLAVGDTIVSGMVRIVRSTAEIARFPEGAVLVAENTDPDWVPLMKRASAVVTDHGGRTSHAAIVSREMGLPAVVGTRTATHVLHDDQEITVSCSEGADGFVYDGIANFEVKDIDLGRVPETRTKVMLNMANPAAALQWWQLPTDGIGLARMEFIINNVIKVHPMALVRFDQLQDQKARKQIAEITRGYDDKSEYFVELLARGIAKIAASQHPKPVVVRMSDFKTNEYANLLGGRQFEPHEENPMIGFRGASRYYSPRYKDGFALECRAMKRVRETMGFTNVIVMIPFCRTPQEADCVLETMAQHGLERHRNGLEVYVMCELPSNIVLAEQFARRFDGFSIGSNDLTQLVLGVDRDSEVLAEHFDERHEAVTRVIRQVIDAAHTVGTRIALCGQAPSDYAQFAEFLVEAGIDAISVSPDSFLPVKRTVAEAEAKYKKKRA
jgi:pyruvate,water dikinase